MVGGMLAIGYARWSSLEQGKGSTLDRQLQAIRGYCTSQKLQLTEMVVDEGSSAYAGTNISSGNLGRLVRKIEEGAIGRDSVLVVEQLDRISRLPPSQVVAFIQRVTNLGVTIATANDGQSISASSIDADPISFMALVFNSFRAHQESKHKSERLAASWRIKRERLEGNDLLPLTGVCPAWLVLDAATRKFVPVPARVSIVVEIFERTVGGEGKRSIATDLNRRGVPTWGRGKSKAAGWHPSYVQKILTNAAVVGEYQPHSKPRGETKRSKVGDPIQGYFPSVVSESLWAAVRSMKAIRPGNNGQRGDVNNLLTGLTRCGHCKGSMVFQMKTGEGVRVRNGKASVQHRASYLSCSGRSRGLSCRNGRHFRYEPLEKGILAAFLNAALSDRFFERPLTLTALVEEEHRALRQFGSEKDKAARLLDLFAETGDMDVRERWLSASAEVKRLESQLQNTAVRLATARGSTTPELHVGRVQAVQHLISGERTDERRDARVKAANSLRELIDHIEFHAGGDLYLALRGSNTVVHMDSTGAVLGDVSVGGPTIPGAHEAGKSILRAGD